MRNFAIKTPFFAQETDLVEREPNTQSLCDTNPSDLVKRAAPDAQPRIRQPPRGRRRRRRERVELSAAATTVAQRSRLRQLAWQRRWRAAVLRSGSSGGRRRASGRHRETERARDLARRREREIARARERERERERDDTRRSRKDLQCASRWASCLSLRSRPTRKTVVPPTGQVGKKILYALDR